MFQYKTDIALAEFDLGGVLYHANYFRLYEKAREAFLKENKVPYSQLVKDGFHLAVAESHQEFLAPIFYGDEIELQLTTAKLKQTTVTLHYSIFANNSLAHKAWTYHALVKKNEHGFKPSRFPENLRTAFARIEGE